MSSEKYPVGQRVCCPDHEAQYTFSGTVVENRKLPGDICVQWDEGFFSSYNEQWLNEHTFKDSKPEPGEAKDE